MFWQVFVGANISEEGHISVVVPAYNEEACVVESLERLNKQLSATFRDYEIILVSDGSTDDTSQRARETLNEHLQVVELPVNMGKGRAVTEGAMVATGQVVALCDADLDLHPEMLVPMIEAVQNGHTDVAIGSKRHELSEVNYPVWRKFLSRSYQVACRMLFGLGLTDTQTGQKAFRREDLMEVLPTVRSDGFAFDMDLLARLHDRGRTIQEFPIVLTYSYGTTVSLRTSVRVLSETLRLWLSRLR